MLLERDRFNEPEYFEQKLICLDVIEGSFVALGDTVNANQCMGERKEERVRRDSKLCINAAQLLAKKKDHAGAMKEYTSAVEHVCQTHSKSDKMHLLASLLQDESTVGFAGVRPTDL
jgi:hypothetical protein